MPAALPSQPVYLLDRTRIRFLTVAAGGAAILFTVAVFLYLYGFHPGHAPLAPDQVSYVVDKDLVRFFKFAGGVLAIFVTVGLSLWGFDVKKAAQEVKESRDETRQILADVRQIRNDVAITKTELIADQQESARLMQAAEQNTRQVAATVAAQQQQIEELLAKSKEEYTTIAHYRLNLNAGTVGSEARKISPGLSRSFSVPELVRFYNFPAELNGHGQTIGLIELGGGFKVSDLNAYFRRLGIPKPRVRWVSVDGAKNDPGGAADGQVTLDIEVAGAVAPGADIVVYFAPNTSDGFARAVSEALADDSNRPSVISIAWGSSEISWTAKTSKKLDQALQSAAERNVTVVCAAGDQGVTDGQTDGGRHVDFPASSPWVLACGGTRITDVKERGGSETVWNDGETFGATGGGFSAIFPLPEWQAGLNIASIEPQKLGRAIPDVAANASPQTGYSVVLHGEELVLGGTSASAPLWAGFIALINLALGRNLGYFNPLLYSTIGPANVLHDVTQGNNSLKNVKGYDAGPGWDACTGWGTPDGEKLIAALRSHLDLLHH